MKNYYLPIGRTVRFKNRDTLISGKISEIQFNVFNPLNNIYLIRDENNRTGQVMLKDIISNEADEPYIPESLLTKIGKMEEIYIEKMMSFDIENIIFNFGLKELKLGQCYFLKDYIQIGEVKSIIFVTKENPSCNIFNTLQFGYYVQNSDGEELFLPNVYFSKAEIVKELAKINK